MNNDTQKPPAINYPPCSKQKREFHQGVLTVVSCRNRRSPNYRNFVDPEHCNTCALRDGEDAVPRATDAGPGRLHRRQPRPDLAAIQLTLPAPDDKDRIFALFSSRTPSPIPSGKRTGSRRRTSTAMSAIRTTPGGSCRSGYPVPCDTSWPFSRPIAAASTYNALQ